MILDSISNIKQYEALSPRLAEALKTAAAYPTKPYVAGRTEIDGDKLFLLAFSYDTKPLCEKSLMEAHRKYVDIMYMVEGEELIYVKPTNSLKVLTMPYDSTKDALLAKVDDDFTTVRLQAGQFVVLYPQDAHCPGCSVTLPQTVKKIICKMSVE